MQHQGQKQFFRQTSWTRAVSVKTTAFPTLKQSGEHGYLGRAREKVAAIISELGVGKEFRQCQFEILGLLYGHFLELAMDAVLFAGVARAVSAARGASGAEAHRKGAAVMQA